MSGGELGGLLADPLYGPLYRARGVEAAERAGWVWTGWSAQEAERALQEAPPLAGWEPRSPQRGASLSERCVLISSGCYGPAHQGHSQMMANARSAVERAWGMECAGGWLSPAHSSYALTKPGALTDSERLRSLDELLAESDWLHVDRWAVSGDRELNFSTLIQRAERASGLRAVYVFGSDNACFAPLFSERYRAVCVERAGSEDARQEIRGRAGLLWAPQPESSRGLSSTAGRGL